MSADESEFRSLQTVRQRWHEEVQPTMATPTAAAGITPFNAKNVIANLRASQSARGSIVSTSSSSQGPSSSLSVLPPASSRSEAVSNLNAMIEADRRSSLERASLEKSMVLHSVESAPAAGRSSPPALKGNASRDAYDDSDDGGGDDDFGDSDSDDDAGSRPQPLSNSSQPSAVASPHPSSSRFSASELSFYKSLLASGGSSAAPQPQLKPSDIKKVAEKAAADELRAAQRKRVEELRLRVEAGRGAAFAGGGDRRKGGKQLQEEARREERGGEESDEWSDFDEEKVRGEALAFSSLALDGRQRSRRDGDVSLDDFGDGVASYGDDKEDDMGHGTGEYSRRGGQESSNEGKKKGDGRSTQDRAGDKHDRAGPGGQATTNQAGVKARANNRQQPPTRTATSSTTTSSNRNGSGNSNNRKQELEDDDDDDLDNFFDDYDKSAASIKGKKSALSKSNINSASGDTFDDRYTAVFQEGGGYPSDDEGPPPGAGGGRGAAGAPQAARNARVAKALGVPEARRTAAKPAAPPKAGRGGKGAVSYENDGDFDNFDDDDSDHGAKVRSTAAVKPSKNSAAASNDDEDWIQKEYEKRLAATKQKVAAKKSGMDSFLDDYGDMNRSDFSKSLPSPSNVGQPRAAATTATAAGGKSNAAEKAANYGVQIKPGGAVRVIKKPSTSRGTEGALGTKPAKFNF